MYFAKSCKDLSSQVKYRKILSIYKEQKNG